MTLVHAFYLLSTHALACHEQPLILKRIILDYSQLLTVFRGESNNPSWTAGAGVLSEMATVQLEFTYLAHHTGKSVYREKALKVFDHLDSISKHNGLYSIYVNTETGQFTKRT